ncbi:MAG TPA: 6-O-methylguanine DNA methyltransferase [candidate division Zixibacteria bacterium]|nr:6-O-methylguanine DNA methyltransferase [candidate division Zixibacteria bacterium]
MPADYIRIEKAIRYLEENHLEQPDLDHLASHLGLSPFHFQRLFKRWCGISPKRFLQFLTTQYAKGLLEESRSVLDVTYESGLSSPGRLHDLFVSVEAVTPGQYKQKGMGLVISYGIHPSPFGDCLIAVTERGVCGLSFVVSGKTEALEDLKSRWPGARIVENPKATKKTFDAIFPKAPRDSGGKITLFLSGTNFQVKVWEALLRIPAGYLASYEDIARLIGADGAAQVVGSAVGANPISYIIPCHRVIRKIGLFGEYHWGAARKKAIIGWEAAQRDKLAQTVAV